MKIFVFVVVVIVAVLVVVVVVVARDLPHEMSRKDATRPKEKIKENATKIN